MPDNERNALNWADRRDRESSQDVWEPTYPDGSVRHECWNSSSLRARKAVPQKTAPRKPAHAEP